MTQQLSLSSSRTESGCSSHDYEVDDRRESAPFTDIVLCVRWPIVKQYDWREARASAHFDGDTSSAVS